MSAMPHSREISRETSAKVANLGLVCSLLVVVIHSQLPSIRINVLQNLLSLVLKSAVPLFFVFSGFFLARRFDERGWYVRALKSRAKSVAVPYVLWLAIACAVAAMAAVERNLLAGNGFSLAGASGFGRRWIGLHPFYYPGLVPFWYLRCLMILVVSSPILKFMLSRLGWTWLAFLFAADSYVLYLTCLGMPTETPGRGLFWVYTLPPHAFLFFSVGLKLGSGATPAMRCVSWRTLGLLAALTVLPSCLVDMRPEAAAPLGLMSIAVVMLALWKLSPPRRWPQSLVSLSFPIYLMHAIVFELYWPFQEHFGLKLHGWWNALAMFVQGVAVPTATCLALRRLFPRCSAILFGGR